jgi:glycosyltransferase involved in cell wall biosynthesis
VAEIESMRESLGIGSGTYLLALSSLEPRKNFARLLQAWREVQHSVPADIELIVAGGTGDPRVFAADSAMPIPPRTRFIGYVPEEHLPALYSGACAFVYPSLYEGFGLPPLEAMACGTPVITSNTTSLPEVVADCAVLVDPLDTSSIAQGIWRVLSCGSLGQMLSQKGEQRSRLFTWERTAFETLQVLLAQSQS